MNKSTRWHLLLAVSLSLSSPHLAHAQIDIAEETYHFADRLPELPGGGGLPALKAAILANFYFPADAPRAQQVGAFEVEATVSAKGQVSYVEASGTAGIKTSVVAAAIAAVRKLPRLKPAILYGEPVQFLFTMHLKLTGQPKSPLLVIDERLTPAPDLSGLSGEGAAPSEPISGDKVYTYVELMPALPGGGGIQGVTEAIGQRLVLPPDAPQGRVFVTFVVNREGVVTDPRIVRGSGSDRTDQAVLAAVAKLPHFTPGKQQGQPVNVQLTMPLSLKPPTSPAKKGGTLPTGNPR
jgi:TonB family protein